MTKGSVKWFNVRNGYGFITSEDGKDYFFHHSNIIMDGFRKLDTDDLVEFETESTENGKEQAVKVTPIKTMKMIRTALEKENLFVKTFRNLLGEEKYMVVNENNVIQTDGNGLSFEELVEYAEI
jgi:CspA family cold shock protein